MGGGGGGGVEGLQRDCAHYLHPVRTSYSSTALYRPKRPKARGLAQHGSPPGWLEEIDPAGVFVRTVPFALTGALLMEFQSAFI
jgi:hypothetical protein